MNQTYAIYKIHAKIDAMSKFLDLDKYIRGEKNSLDQIRSYYKTNHWAYRHFHSQEGFMHFRVSPGGFVREEDCYYQPNRVAEYIKPNSTVLELGFGQGANLLYLAHSFPDVKFYGIDLLPRKDMEIPDNVTIFKQDYSSFPQIEDNSLDVVYAFETTVHNSDKEKIFREVCRALKPGGVFIVYEYALTAEYETFEPYLQKAISLISKGAASPLVESVDAFNRHFVNSGFTIENFRDYTEEMLPDLKRLEHEAARCLERPWLARIIFAVCPTQFVTNAFLGYLAYDSGKAGAMVYDEWVLRKP